MIKEGLIRGLSLLLLFTVLCGGIYTLGITGLAQILFPENANGSVIEIDGKKYGSALLGQEFNDESHMWGRIMKVDVSTFIDENGTPLMYGAPSNLSPASKEYEELVSQRVEMIRSANPDMKETAIPVDLVTGSGSGLDPHISMAAANYQVSRLAKENGLTEDEVQSMIDKSSSKRFLGIFGEETVNVLKVNLMIEGILA